ncbi:DUF2079 domain-containing protein [Sulfobacillus thermosulfidooxidans]|uniref:DUF2079 domain-containing protein n=1 Tax=Sulfobacillus thermosulfidooxidans TaxID=28034 RepID=UPI0009DD48CF|nr:DUF2079 domain-containing protein [Sulfobacillus thermosulfidooxidans]
MMTESVWIKPEVENRDAQYFGVGLYNRIFAYVAIVLSAQILRWSLYVAHGFDLGFYQQALAAWVHEGLHATSTYFPGPVLAHNDAWLMIFLAYPATWLGTGFLFFTETLGLALGYIPLAKLAKLWDLSPASLIVIGGLYLLNPLLIAGNLYDFHMSLLAIPVLLWSFVLAQESRLGAFTLTLLLFTGFGIHGTLVLVVFMLVLLLQKDRWFALVTFSLLIVWFLVLHLGFHLSWARWLLPGVYPLHFQISLRTVLYSIWVIAPFLFVATLILRHKAFYLSPYWIMALIGLSIHLFSSNLAQSSPFDQDSAWLVPFLLWAVMDTLRHFSRVTWSKKAHGLITAVLLGMLALMALDFYHSAWRVRPQNTAALTKALAHVSLHQAIYAQNNVLPHLGMTPYAVPLSRLNPSHLAYGAQVIWDTQFSDHTTSAKVYAFLRTLSHSPKADIVFQDAGVIVFDITARH